MDRLRRVIVVAAAVSLAAGCEHRAEPPPPGLPPLVGGAPLAPGPGAVHPPTGANAPGAAGGLPAGHPALPPGHPATPGDDAIVGETPEGDLDPSATVTGVLVLSDKIKDRVATGEVIFLVARQDDGSDKGQVLAVKRLTVGAWPQPFQLDGSAPMFPGTKFAGKILVSARVDKDGDGMTKNAGDALGVVRTTVPASGVKVVIDTITK